MRGPKRTRGNPPVGDEWIQLGEWIEGDTSKDGQVWIVYARPGGEGWLTVKVIRMVPEYGPGKANYWMGWQVDQKRLSSVRDTGVMTRRAPQRLKRVRAILEGSDWIV